MMEYDGVRARIIWEWEWFEGLIGSKIVPSLTFGIKIFDIIMENVHQLFLF